MKKTLLFMLVLFCTVSISAQNKISYEYDVSGNRTKRTLVVATRTLMADEQPEEIITEELSKREVKIYSTIQGQVSVEISTLEGMKYGTISIYSFPNGITVRSRKIQNLREDLDISSKISGIYIIVVDIDGEKTSIKVMKN